MYTLNNNNNNKTTFFGKHDDSTVDKDVFSRYSTLLS